VPLGLSHWGRVIDSEPKGQVVEVRPGYAPWQKGTKRQQMLRRAREIKRLKHLARKEAAAREIEAVTSSAGPSFPADSAERSVDEESSEPRDSKQSPDPPPAVAVASTVAGHAGEHHPVDLPDVQNDAELPVVSQSSAVCEQLMLRGKPPASPKRFRFQRGPEPSARTWYRRAEQSKARQKAAENVRKIDSFFKPA
jgi:hypothetical protein